MLHAVQSCHAPGDPPDREDRTASPYEGFPLEGDDLPYKVEVWDATGRYVEHVVAVSVSPAIGYAAYYAAAREFPGRAVTLRHKGTVLSRWSDRSH